MEWRELSQQAQSIVDKVISDELSVDELEDALSNEEYAVDHPAIREALAFLSE